MGPTSDKYGSAWSRDELVLALYLYCQIPFSKTKANNPEVIALAQALGRTPSSVARKLGNFGAFDPTLASQGISGLLHYGKNDQALWDEYSGNWEKLVADSNSLLLNKNAKSPLAQGESMGKEDNLLLPTGPSVESRTVEARLHQSFFRRSVLASYETSCCVCELDIASLLVASHIVPWSVNEGIRADPRNGLCMCVLHDRAFDRGLLAMNGMHQIAVSKSVLRSRSSFVQATLVTFNGGQMKLPKRFLPNPEYLQWHYDHIYEQS